MTKMAKSTTPATMISGMVSSPDGAPIEAFTLDQPEDDKEEARAGEQTPTMSSRCRRPGQDRARPGAPPEATNPNGTFTKKIQRQLM